MTAFPTTPLLITGARPYPDLQGGTRAMNDIFAWGVATYPGRFGIMNSQLHATSAAGYYLNAAIYGNYLYEPTGIQFLCNSASDDNVARLSNSPPYGDDPLLSAYDAMNNSFTAAVNFGCKFVEVYETDVENPAYQTMLATQGAALQLRAAETPTADLSVTVTDGVTTVNAGTSVTYTIVVTNNGPGNVPGAPVSDNFPAVFTGMSFTATQTGGASGFTASGSGNINDTVTMPSGSVITYTATGTIPPTAPSGSLSDTATVTAPSGATDNKLTNNSATDSDTLVLSANLKVTVTDGKSSVVSGQSDTYTIVVTNNGLGRVTGAMAGDSFPTVFTGVTFTATQTGGASGFTANGSGNIHDTVTMPGGSVITYTATGTIDPSAASGTLSDTATVSVPNGVTDPVLTNNSATDSDTLVLSADLKVTVTDGQSR